MKGLSVHLLLLCLQIYSASKLASGSSSIGKRSNAGFLIKTKSGKTFLQLAGKKTRITKDTWKESSNNYSNDGNANEKATGKKGAKEKLTDKKDAKFKVTGKKGAKEKVTGNRGVNKQLLTGQ